MSWLNRTSRVMLRLYKPQGKRVKSFFTMPEYEAWKEETDGGRGWTIKYYKGAWPARPSSLRLLVPTLTCTAHVTPGLGTSTSKEAKEYFGALAEHQIPFEYTDEADDRIELAFAKKRVTDRKDWLSTFVVSVRREPGCRMQHQPHTCRVSRCSRAPTWTTV